MSTTVPASTKVRWTRVAHVDTDRLMRRRDHILATRAEFARAADARIELRQRGSRIQRAVCPDRTD